MFLYHAQPPAQLLTRACCLPGLEPDAQPGTIQARTLLLTEGVLDNSALALFLVDARSAVTASDPFGHPCPYPHLLCCPLCAATLHCRMPFSPTVVLKQGGDCWTRCRSGKVAAQALQCASAAHR